MRKILLFLLSSVIGFSLFILVAKTIGWQEIKSALLVFTGWQGLVILLLTFLIAIIHNWKWQKILEGQGICLPFWDLFRYYLAGFSVMFLAPALLLAGEVFRGYALKKNSNVSGTKVMTSVFIDRFLEWTANAIVAFLGVLLFLYYIGIAPKNLIVIFIAATILSALALFFYFRLLKQKSIARLFFKISGLKNSNLKEAVFDAERTILNFLSLKRSSLGDALVLTLVRTIVMYFRAYILIIFLGKAVAALPTLTILGFNYLATALPIPAALGSHEALQVLAFSVFGLGSSTATAFAMIIRAAELLFALAGLVVLFRLSIMLLKKFLFEKADKLARLIDRDNY